MTTKHIIPLLLLCAQIATAQQRQPQFALKMGINASVTAFSRASTESLAYWPNPSVPSSMFSPILVLPNNWELFVPILVFDQTEQRSLQVGDSKTEGTLTTAYQTGAGVMKYWDGGKKIGRFPYAMGLGINAQFGKHTFTAPNYSRVTRQYALEYLVGPKILLKEWNRLFIDANILLVVRSNWDRSDDNRDIVEVVARPIRLQPRVSVGYRL